MIYFLAGVAAIAGLLFGYDEGIIAVARPLLEQDFPLSPFVAGFMTASVPLGALFGAIVAGRLTERLGRRYVLMLAAGLFAVGAGVAAGTEFIAQLVVARLVLGLAIGSPRSWRRCISRRPRHCASAAGWWRPISSLLRSGSWRPT